MHWQDDLNLVDNLDRLCQAAEKIKMVHKAAYMVTIFYSAALFLYPKNLNKLDEIFDPALRDLHEKWEAENNPEKQEQIRGCIHTTEQVKADYENRIKLWYELGDKSVFVRLFERIDNLYGLKASELKLLEETYRRYNQGKGDIHFRFIKWQLSLASPTDVHKPGICQAAEQCPEARQFLDYLQEVPGKENAGQNHPHLPRQVLNLENSKISLREKINYILGEESVRKENHPHEARPKSPLQRSEK